MKKEAPKDLETAPWLKLRSGGENWSEICCIGQHITVTARDYID